MSQSSSRQSRTAVFAGLGAAAAGAAALMLFAATTSGAPSKGTGTAGTATYAPSSSAYAVNYRTKRDDAAKAAQKGFELELALYASGGATIDDVVKWSERIREAHYDAAEHRDRLIRLEAEVQKRVAAGTATAVDEQLIAYYRAIAESTAP